MKRFRFGVTEICYGCIDVEAETYEEAYEKASCMDGDYFVNKSDVEVRELLDISLK